MFTYHENKEIRPSCGVHEDGVAQSVIEPACGKTAE